MSLYICSNVSNFTTETNDLMQSRTSLCPIPSQRKQESAPSAERFKFCHVEKIWDTGGKRRRNKGWIKLTGRGPSSRPTQAEPVYETKEVVLQKREGAQRPLVSAHDLAVTLLPLAGASFSTGLLSLVISVPCSCGTSAAASRQPDAAEPRRGSRLHFLSS